MSGKSLNDHHEKGEVCETAIANSLSWHLVIFEKQRFLFKEISLNSLSQWVLRLQAPRLVGDSTSECGNEMVVQLLMRHVKCKRFGGISARRKEIRPPKEEKGKVL